ncbi:MAG: hypothetical protein ABWZ30_07005 [Jiangellaceae bacterium]
MPREVEPIEHAAGGGVLAEHVGDEVRDARLLRNLRLVLAR